MAGVGTVAALILAALLVAAAVPKLARPAATRAAFTALRVPAPRLLTRATPIAELTTAGLLVVAPRAGGTAALALLAAFTAFLATRLSSGVACGCFGSTQRRPVSAVELVRNTLLGMLAGAACLAAQPTVPALADAVLATTATALGAVALALVDVKVGVGRLIDNSLEVRG